VTFALVRRCVSGRSAYDDSWWALNVILRRRYRVA
jgi:hypothetical protein